MLLHKAAVVSTEIAVASSVDSPVSVVAASLPPPLPPPPTFVDKAPVAPLQRLTQANGRRYSVPNLDLVRRGKNVWLKF
jgi:hypothetical protein